MTNPTTTNKIGTLLLIEDNLTNIYEFKKYFENSDYSVDSVRSKVEAENYLYRTTIVGNKPDLVVVNYHLSEQAGPALCRQIKNTKDLSSIPVLIFSSRDELGFMTEAFKAGAEYYVATGSNGLREVEVRTQAILLRRLRRF